MELTKLTLSGEESKLVEVKNAGMILSATGKFKVQLINSNNKTMGAWFVLPYESVRFDFRDNFIEDQYLKLSIENIGLFESIFYIRQM